MGSSGCADCCGAAAELAAPGSASAFASGFFLCHPSSSSLHKALSSGVHVAWYNAHVSVSIQVRQHALHTPHLLRLCLPHSGMLKILARHMNTMANKGLEAQMPPE